MFEFDATISSAVVSGDAPASPAPTAGPLTPALLDRMHRYWSAANYLTIGQIYLQDNPLLREPLVPRHIKPRLLGHWGTSPGLSFVYVHLNRLIREQNTNVIFLAGPGHGGPAVLANVYLEGTYSEIYPHVSQDLKGLHRLCRQFSTPGGVPSHVSVPTPGSIHEGGELGYVLAHAFGAAFDNPDLLVAAVVGDGEAETGPLAGSWKSISFLNPARDGAVLPILHLNGYKIAGPTVWGRTPDEQLRQRLEGDGYDAQFVEGDDPMRVHQLFAATLDSCYQRIRDIQTRARTHRGSQEARWPAIVLRTPKGWTGPKALHDLAIEGTFRAHQVPLADVKDDPQELALLDAWMRGYHPERLFDREGRLLEELRSLAPDGDRRMGANPHANGGRLRVPLDIPPFTDYALPVERPATQRHESTRCLGQLLRDVFVRSRGAANFRLMCPDETSSNRLGDVFAVENRCYQERTIAIDDHVSAEGRVMEVLSEHLCEGWLEGYLLTGRHGLFVSYEAFAMISASMTVQHTKWLQEARNLPWRAPIASLNILLTSTCWRNDHNGFSHQGPGLIDVMLSKRGSVARIYLPPDANCLLSVADHCLRSTNYVNLIVIDKQPQLQWLDKDAAIAHCARGASMWAWASTNDGRDPDVVIAAAGDVPTLEATAAAAWLRARVPDLRVRFVNIVNLMTLFPADVHPHGMDDDRFISLFTADQPIIFAFHGYQRAIHEIVHGRPHAERFHVRGFNEQGTTTTPFTMVALNEMSRYHLAIEAIRRVPRLNDRAPELIAECRQHLEDALAYAHEHLEDPPAISQWIWPAA
ncbi:MAG TPA: phosphoketolase family protein [Vicinamibacterales bacterium]|nr:phosphoketolase family protein [Vicinamibacterales bacterium]